MKALFFIVFLFLSISVFAETSLTLLAKNVETKIYFHTSTVETIRARANSASDSADAMIERDLSICQSVGQISKDRSDTFEATQKLLGATDQLEDREFLNAISGKILTENFTLSGFCLKGFNGEYRNIETLKAHVELLDQNLNELKKYIGKWM
jgi:hypothetical protein